ncbi:outer membrane beta-barrel protein [Hyphomonas sp.]|uniref:outer membrane beta-barrel protein n=1 Tax=Hyphomonas sp. TaxID=87 RepID=UPI0035272BA9
MNHLKRLCLLTVAGGSLIAGTAAAQGQGADNFYSRNKYEAVKDRRQPAFDPEPIRLGTFLVDATALAGVTYNSNVYAQNNNEQSDVIIRIGGEVAGRTNWNVHQIGFDVSAYQNEYLDLSDESAPTLHAGLRGRLDVSREFSLGARVFADKSVEQRYEPAGLGGLEKPIKYSIAGGEVSADYTNDRVRWNNAVGVRDFNYEDGRIVGSGAVADQDFRDRQDTYGRTRLSYAVSPDLAVFAQGTVHDESYDSAQLIGGQPRYRDSEGYSVSAGVDFELQTLIRGDIAVGYLNEDKKDDFFADVDGLSLDARIQWFPSRLTTVTFTGRRSVRDTGVFASPSSLATSFGAEVDHELRRNLILSAQAGYTDYEYQEIDRTDEMSNFGVAAKYKMNKRLHVDAFARHLSWDSSGANLAVVRSYGINLIGVELRYHP